MSKSTLKLISGILLVFLGLCHQSAHVMFSLESNPPPIVEDMKAFKIELMGTHTLAQFHDGFSLMTGFFLLFLGFIILILRKKINDHTLDFVITATIFLVCILSVFYFHILAYGISGIAGLFYLTSNFKQPSL